MAEPTTVEEVVVTGKRKKPNFAVRAARTARLAVGDPGAFVEGAKELPGSVLRGVKTYAQTHTPQQFGADVVRTGKNIVSDVVEHPVQTVLGALPLVGGAMSAIDTAKAREAAADARARGDERTAQMYEQIAAASAGTILAGMIPGGRTVAKGLLKEGEQAAVKEAEKLAARYIDPESTRIADWQWRPQEDVKAELGLTEVPPHVVDYGRFMDEQASRATKGQMTPRDLLKAYGITRSSMQRSALSLPTAQKRGLDLEHLGVDEVRPEGAFSELLGTPEGQAYLDAAQRGQVNDKAIADMMTKFAPYGFQNALGDDLTWAAKNLPQHSSQVADMVAAAREGASDPEDWTRFVKDRVRGVDAAKAGFVGAMMGRGDLPTLDARQIILQTGKPTKEASKYLSRKKGEGSVEAVKRLTARMGDLNLALPPELEPYRQHLTHHTVWDKASDEVTTHADVMNALKGYAEGGPVVPGNIDLHNRPVVRNADDSISTVLSITVGFGDKTYVLPRVVGGKVVSNQEAIDHFRQTGEHLGAYDKQKDAEDYSQRLHEEQAKEYKDKARGGLMAKYGL